MFVDTHTVQGEMANTDEDGPPVTRADVRQRNSFESSSFWATGDGTQVA